VSAPHGRGENALRRWCRGVGVLGSFDFAQDDKSCLGVRREGGSWGSCTLLARGSS